MTTTKTLKKLIKFKALNISKKAPTSEDELYKELVSYFYPFAKLEQYQKCVSRLALSIETINMLDYFEFNSEAKTYDEMITITTKGAQRLETREDKLINFFYGLGGIAIGSILSLVFSLIF